MNLFKQYLPWLVVASAGAYLFLIAFPPGEGDKQMHLEEFGAIPVQDNGRVKPLDSIARSDLIVVAHKTTFQDTEDETQPAVRWMLDVMLSRKNSNSKADDYKVFRIENDEVAALMHLKPRFGMRYSLNEMRSPWYRLTASDIDALKKLSFPPDALATLKIPILRKRKFDSADEFLMVLREVVGKRNLNALNLWQNYILSHAPGYQVTPELLQSLATATVPESLTSYLEGIKGSDERLFKDSPEVSAALNGFPDRNTLEQWRPLVADQIEKTGLKELEREIERALAVQEQDPKQLTLYDHKILEASNQLHVYEQLVSMQGLRISPTGPESEEWQEFLTALNEEKETQDRGSFAGLFANMLTSYSAGNVDEFNKWVVKYQEKLDQERPREARRARFEAWFNRTEPFYHCSILYVCAFLLVLLGWLGIPLPLNRAAFWLIAFTLSVQVLGLSARMFITGRPFVFVTNLYSSAVYIGSLAVALGLLIEWLYPLGIGNAKAAAIGFATLLIAHNLAAGGEDTMAVLLPVLDTNFWLATHVTAVTSGYAATYAAGALGLTFVLLQIYMVVRRYLNGARDGATVWLTYTLGLPFLFFAKLRSLMGTSLEGTPLQPVNIMTPLRLSPGMVLIQPLVLDKELIRLLGRLIYGVVCFATLLSFVGTVLGGIWADQSWGRFWGWDPKENGALIIVIWNALILHARWGGMVQQRGMAALSLVGNIVTTWSWFGVNMLGVGLHSYGFMEGAAFWVTSWIGFNLLMIGVCLMPPYLWRADAEPQVQPATGSLPTQPNKGRREPRPVPRGAVKAPSPVYR